MDTKNSYWAHNELVLNSHEALSTADVLLSPTTGILPSRSHADLSSVFLFSSPMDTVTGPELTESLLSLKQAPVFCRFLDEELIKDTLSKHCEDENFWFSVGANQTHYDYLQHWAINNPDKKLNISVDIAHGDMRHLYKLYSLYSNASWCKALMSGTVSTPESAKALYDAGCTHIRVGIGPGSACSTRIVTGCGLPNLTAVYNIWAYFEQINQPSPFIIADGGITNSADIIKYLSAGADAVMMGSLFSKTQESHGWKTSPLKSLLNKLSLGILFHNKINYKRYRGQASKEFQIDRITTSPKYFEGVQGPLQYPQYTASELVASLEAAISSAISYLGLSSIKDLNPKNVKFIKITQAAQLESRPHLLEK